MEAVSQGARHRGGHVVGVTAPTVFPDRTGANEYVDDEAQASSLIERIGLLVDGTDGAIALWGSLGTATELLVAWNAAFVAPFSNNVSKPVVAVGEPWQMLVPLLEATLAIDPGSITVVDTVDDAARHMATVLR